MGIIGNTFFTSDTHFSHDKIIEYCNRPYTSAAEMDEALVENWNKTISKNDVVFHLGDVSWGRFDLSRLNGDKHLIVGNHDNLKDISRHFSTISQYSELKGYLPKGRKLILMHYPIESWNGKFHRSVHLHGHSHNTCDNSGLLRFDVGVDSWSMLPTTLEQIEALIPTRLDQEAETRRRDDAFKDLNRRADES